MEGSTLASYMGSRLAIKGDKFWILHLSVWSTGCRVWILVEVGVANVPPHICLQMWHIVKVCVDDVFFVDDILSETFKKNLASKRVHWLKFCMSKKIKKKVTNVHQRVVVIYLYNAVTQEYREHYVFNINAFWRRHIIRAILKKDNLSIGVRLPRL